MNIFVRIHIEKFAKREYNQEKERAMRRKEERKLRIAEFNTPAAENITRIIAEKGLKQVYVAEKAGYKAQEFNDMLNGRRLIKACDIPRIATVLGVKADDIYEAGKKGE